MSSALRTYDPNRFVTYVHIGVPTPDVVVFIPPTERPPVPPSRR